MLRVKDAGGNIVVRKSGIRESQRLEATNIPRKRYTRGISVLGYSKLRRE